MYAAGIDPSAYEANRASNSDMSALTAHQNAQRVPRERIRLSKTVVEKPDVVLLYEIRVVPEHRDRGRRDLDLRRVVELHFPTGGLGRLAPREQFGEALVDLRRRNSCLALRRNPSDDVQDLRDALARLRRRKEERNKLQEGRFLGSGLLIPGRRLVVLLGNVPLVDHHDQRSATLPRQCGDLEILILDLPLRRIDEQNADVGSLDGTAGPRRPIKLAARFPAGPPAAPRPI